MLIDVYNPSVVCFLDSWGLFECTNICESWRAGEGESFCLSFVKCITHCSKVITSWSSHYLTNCFDNQQADYFSNTGYLTNWWQKKQYKPLCLLFICIFCVGRRVHFVKVFPPAAIRTLPVCDCPKMSPNCLKVAHGHLLTAMFLDQRQNTIN